MVKLSKMGGFLHSKKDNCGYGLKRTNDGKEEMSFMKE